MPGVKVLRKIQLGAESAAGTAVAATALWRGMGSREGGPVVKFPEEHVGYLSGLDRSYAGSLEAKATLEGEATFEQLPYIFAAGIKNTVTGAADGVGTSKIYAYAFPTTSANTIKTYTIEGGDNQAAEEMEYSFVTGFKLSGKPREALMVSADWIGRQISTSTYTGAIAVPTVEEIPFATGVLYLDAIGGTIGTTLKSNTLLGMEVDVKTGLQPVWTGDGQLYFAFHKQVAPEITVKMTFEHDTTSVAEKAIWRAQTARLLRLQFTGSAVGTPGTTYSKKTLRLDMAGKWEKFDKLDEIDGNDVVSGTFRARYNGTAAQFATFTVVNELTALP